MKGKILATILALTLVQVGNNQIIATENEIASGSSLEASKEIVEDATELVPIPDQEEKTNMKYVIKKLSVPHCKRGPERCQLCREMAEPRWCLLDVDPPDKEILQRPVIELAIDGERHFLVYDVIKSFASEEEARLYMTTGALPDILWDSTPCP
ncbi:MAG: hypothetical protein CVV42_17210 [Candidatus Riflebacteria bacterium HGW-Riflebacteria-2]|jgi:hypothetical protein|nr:MAG: hypothetical protein CVV42_17210 [Candidatus Riflebacteria bacterium HGW-Riflebacteria-2]